jgi:hypothetical protein
VASEQSSIKKTDASSFAHRGDRSADRGGALWRPSNRPSKKLTRPPLPIAAAVRLCVPTQPRLDSNSGDIYEAVHVKRAVAAVAEDSCAPARRRRPRSICPISAGVCRNGFVPPSAPAWSRRRRANSARESLRVGPTRRYAQTSIRDRPREGRPMRKRSDGRRHSPYRASGMGPRSVPGSGSSGGRHVAARLNTPRFNSCGPTPASFKSGAKSRRLPVRPLARHHRHHQTQ